MTAKSEVIEELLELTEMVDTLRLQMGPANADVAKGRIRKVMNYVRHGSTPKEKS